MLYILLRYVTLHCIRFDSIPFRSITLRYYYITCIHEETDKHAYISSGMWHIHALRNHQATGDLLSLSTLGWLTLHSWNRIWKCHCVARFLTRSSIGQRSSQQQKLLSIAFQIIWRTAHESGSRNRSVHLVLVQGINTAISKLSHPPS